MFKKYCFNFYLFLFVGNIKTELFPTQFKPELVVMGDHLQLPLIQFGSYWLNHRSKIRKKHHLPRYPTRNRIIGGKAANIKDFPSMACIILKHFDQDDFRGGAAIISNYWAVTAAHCMFYIDDEAIQHRKAAIRSNTEFWKEGYMEHIIVGSYSHEKYDKELTDFDIAVVRVSQPFISQFEKPILIANTTYRYEAETTATVLGWGTTDPNTSEPFVVERLRYVRIALKSFRDCKKSYAGVSETITSRMFCVISPGRDACVYDSGGPLIQNNVLIGIVSWAGTNCADDRLPGVYTRISLFSEWIYNKIKEF